MEAAAVTHADHGDHHGPPEANRSSRVEPQLLGMLLFIISEVMIFGAFFTAYFFIRVVNHDPWPGPGFDLPKNIAAFNTGDTSFAATFFGLTGLHGAHVFVGLTILSVMMVRAFRGHFSAEHHHGLELPAIYWHFVDVMWIVVYTTVYIL